MLYKKPTKFVFSFLLVLNLIIVGLIGAIPVLDKTNERGLVSFPVENERRDLIFHRTATLLSLIIYLDLEILKLKVGAFVFEENGSLFIGVISSYKEPVPDGGLEFYLDDDANKLNNGHYGVSDDGYISAKLGLVGLVKVNVIGHHLIIKLKSVVILELPIVELLVLL